MTNKKYILIALFFLIIKVLFAQETYKLSKNDKRALEGVYLEKYYKATDKDVNDTVGGKLAKNSITYRIFIDLKPGYKLQSVFGSKLFPLNIETSTYFYNDTIMGKSVGDNINDKRLNQHNVALDSWVSLGSGSCFHQAVPLKDDPDTSIIKNKFGTKDGLIYSDVYKVVYFGTDLKFFKDSVNSKILYSDNIAWANYAGAEGPTPKNEILIAQLTTNGDLSFNFNIQISTPKGGVIQFVSKKQNLPIDDQNPFPMIYSKCLTYKNKK
jgi:hypothetical protein